MLKALGPPSEGVPARRFTLILALAVLALAGAAPVAAADPVGDCLANPNLVHSRGPGADGCVAVAQNGDARGDVFAFSLKGDAEAGVAAYAHEGTGTAPVALEGCCIVPYWVPNPFCDYNLPFAPCFHKH